MFLSLVFLLVFALFGTLLETARYTVCKNHAARTLRTGAEGLLSEYNRPLYEHYGLFFIEKGGTPYEQVIGRYAGDTISAADKGEMDFLDGGIDDIQVKNKKYSYPSLFSCVAGIFFNFFLSFPIRGCGNHPL